MLVDMISDMIQHLSRLICHQPSTLRCCVLYVKRTVCSVLLQFLWIFIIVTGSVSVVFFSTQLENNGLHSHPVQHAGARAKRPCCNWGRLFEGSDVKCKKMFHTMKKRTAQ